MKTVSVVCDGCGADLSRTSNSVDYRLLLTVEDIPSGGGAVTDMMFYPPIEQNAHFCGVKCLRTWMDKEGHLK